MHASTTGRKSMDRLSMRSCDYCRRKKKLCNGQQPCSLCQVEAYECQYTMPSPPPPPPPSQQGQQQTLLQEKDGNRTTTMTTTTTTAPLHPFAHARGSILTTNASRRLSSGSACETCRRRKTKCDGGSPCAFCAANQIPCVNHFGQRRKRSSIQQHTQSALAQPMTPAASTAAQHLTKTSNSQQNAKPASQQHHSQGAAAAATAAVEAMSISNTSESSPNGKRNSLSAGRHDHEAIDRIQVRLRRIEDLMTAFTSSATAPSPKSPLAQSVHPTNSPDRSSFVRPQRHSVQGISAKREQLHLARRAMSSSPPYTINKHGNSMNEAAAAVNGYLTPPNSGGKKRYGSPPPPGSDMSRQHSAGYTLPSAMGQLSVSPPSSSSTTGTPPDGGYTPASSLSTPLLEPCWDNNASLNAHAMAAQNAMPSLMDQLSERTFCRHGSFA
ncbi:hypothetical protein BC940DRAFT_290867 [Gongronella butleri]|nr:hypothetical protein BC940DRAFT_290867 [Gongronella butleri]